MVPFARGVELIMKTCKAEGCDNKILAKDYCRRHYKQMWKYGKILNRTNRDPNEIVIKGSFAEIVLYNIKNKETARVIIDTEDIGKIKKYKWSLSKNGYVRARSSQEPVKIQHIIMGVRSKNGKDIDHKDQNKLNNRKSNFRFCTQAENLQNRGKQKNNTSGFKGVSWDKARKRWKAQIAYNSKNKFIGRFKDKISAAVAYNTGAIKHHGEFAYLNPT